MAYERSRSVFTAGPVGGNSAPRSRDRAVIQPSFQEVDGEEGAVIANPSSNVNTWYELKPLPPVPLHPKRRERHTFQASPNECQLNTPPPLTRIPGFASYERGDSPESSVGQYHTEDEERKNKPLPLEPLGALEPQAATIRRQELLTPTLDNGVLMKASTVSTGELHQRFHLDPTIDMGGKDQSIASRPCAKYSPQSTLKCPPKSRPPAVIDARQNRDFLMNFFGFDSIPQMDVEDAILGQIQCLMSVQPHPDTVVHDALYPIASCIWLRDFIVASLPLLNFDRDRLQGLRFMDSRTIHVHRGFGLLWDFVAACGPVIGHGDSEASHCCGSSKEYQLAWFQKRFPRASEAEHMHQIWNALKALLIAHSSQGPPHLQGAQGGVEERSRWPVTEDVVAFMKRGLGDIQQYFTKSNSNTRYFWDNSGLDGFFVDACMEWQDYQIRGESQFDLTPLRED